MRDWHKSTYSAAADNCVEVMEAERVLIRDTQNRELGQLGFAAGEWAALIEALAAN